MAFRITGEIFRIHPAETFSTASGTQITRRSMTLLQRRFDRETGEEEEILIENTESRKQLENRENAMRLLRSQLYDRALQKRKAEQAKIEAGKKKIEWGSRCPRSRRRRVPWS